MNLKPRVAKLFHRESGVEREGGRDRERRGREREGRKGREREAHLCLPVKANESNEEEHKDYHYSNHSDVVDPRASERTRLALLQ
ncbi:MAG: hypothetical protein MJE68_27460 [Proteobacteria bacterium]|nr:hypothetical protein [Pseudomonadota bacterium]